MTDPSGGTRFLDAAGTFQALEALAARSRAEPLEGFPWDAGASSFESRTPAGGCVRRAPSWAGAAGALILRDGRCLVYLAPGKPRKSCFPSELVLDMPAGRYSVRTWDCGAEAYTGIEVASAPPLVCGPPGSGAELLVLVEAL